MSPSASEWMSSASVVHRAVIWFPFCQTTGRKLFVRTDAAPLQDFACDDSFDTC
jgi:hypothetical protein